MKLGKTEIGKILHNVISYDYDADNRLHFRRFTESQRNTYESHSRRWHAKIKASASVTFDFFSDSDYIAVEFDLYPGSSHNWAGFDLYIDGIFFGHKKLDNMDAKIVSFDLPKGEHRITLYFPWSVQTVVKYVHLSDNASIKPVSKKAKAIFLGDSITQGYITEYTSLTYVNQIARDADIEVINQGVGAYYFRANSIDDSLASYKPDFIVVAYGTNDYSHFETEVEYERFASSYIDRLTGIFPNTKILGVLPIYRNDEKNQIREKTRSYTLDDAREILANIYAKYENVRVLKETGIPRIPDAFASDYVHPNELGFGYMAKAIEKEIQKFL